MFNVEGVYLTTRFKHCADTYVFLCSHVGSDIKLIGFMGAQLIRGSLHSNTCSSAKIHA